MLTLPPRIQGTHLTEALSKRRPKRASVASLRLFTINRNTGHVHRNTHRSGDDRLRPATAGGVLDAGAVWADAFAEALDGQADGRAAQLTHH